MAVDERARHELFLKVERALGPEAAETLMGLMPPVGWADMATRDDLRQLEDRINGRFESLGADLRGEMQRMRADILQTLVHETHAQFRNLVVLCSSMVFAVAGLAFAAARLT
jgi:hypothetical protein